MVNVGFIYDFDLTLSEEFQQYPLFRKYIDNLREIHGVNSPEEYWKLCDGVHLKIGWLQQFVKDCKEGNFPAMTNEILEKEFGPKVQLSPGLPEWFDRINEFGKIYGLDISHHVISSGAEAFIKGTKVFPHLSSLYAGSFEENGVRIDRVGNMVSSFEKIEAIKRICKGEGVDLFQDLGLGDYFIQRRRLLIFGDGQTDRSMFRYGLERGSASIGVVEENNKRVYDKTVKQLGNDVVRILPRNYREGSVIDREVKEMLIGLAETSCDMDPDLVYRHGLNQIINPGIKTLVGKHLEDCAYCTKRKGKKFIYR